MSKNVFSEDDFLQMVSAAGSTAAYKLSAKQWNECYEPGMMVRYYPTVCSDDFETRRTSSKAWENGAGDVLVHLYGVAGGVSIHHCFSMQETA